MKEKQPKKVKCPNKECEHEWEYKGNSKFYITCPQCHKKFNLKKQTK